MRKLGLALTLTLLSAFSASADIIDGSLGITTFGATLGGGSDLSTATTMTPTVLLTGGASGDFTAIPDGTPGTGGVVNLNNLGSFVIDFGSFGYFSSTSGQIVDRNANFLKVIYSGNYSGLGTFDLSPVTFRVSMTYSSNGNSTAPTFASYGGTLASPVPEPSSYALFGLGLGGLFALRRLR